MDKIIQLEDHFPTGEPTVQAVLRAGHRGQFHFEKTAFLKTGSPAYDYIQSVVPEIGSTYVLVNALGAFEAYDSNRNGDGFPYMPYRVGVRAPAAKPGNGDGLDGWISPAEVLTRHYQTFEQAHAFEHHVNKDPGKSFGSVIKAFWNERMKRVELLLKLNNNRNPRLIQRINDGEYPAVSMGARVRWDLCTRCGNRAPTRKEYCDHLRYHMNNVDPASGIRMCALNPSPVFFDISFVVRPADKTGYMLKKVAHEIWSHPSAELGEKVAAFNAKQATVRKIGDIQKRITGGQVISKKTPEEQLVEQYRDTLLPQNVGNLAPAGDKEVTAMAQHPLRVTLSSLHKVGAFLSTGELARVILSREGIKTSAETLNRIVLLQPTVLEAFARYPDAYDKMAALVEIDPKLASERLLRDLQPWLEKRATMAEYLRQRALEPGGIAPAGWGPGYAYEAGAPPKSDMLTMTDPHTGATYSTTRGAAQAADAVNRRSLFGGTALLGGAATLGMGLLPGMRSLPLPLRAAAGIGLGYMGARKLMQAQQPYRHPGYMTDQGVFVPGNIEFAKTSELTPSVQFLDKLAFDYVERLGGWPVSNKLASALIQRTQSAAIRNFLDGDAAEKIATLLRSCEDPSYDSTEPPKIGMDRLTDVFGHLVAAP